MKKRQKKSVKFGDPHAFNAVISLFLTPDILL